MSNEFFKIIEVTNGANNQAEARPNKPWLFYAALCLVGGWLAPYSLGLAAPVLLFGIVKLVWQKRTRVAVVATLIGPLYACIHQVILAKFPALLHTTAWMDATTVSHAAQSNAIFGLVAALMALMLGIEFADRITLGVISAISLAGAALYAGLEYLLFRGAEGLGATFVQSLNEAMKVFMPSDIAAQMMMESVQQIFNNLWFVAYMQETFFFTALACLGVMVASKSSLRQPSPVDVLSFDAPLWVVAALICGIAAMIMALFPVPEAHLFVSVGATTILCCRFPLMLQGFSVLLHILNKRRVGCMARTAAVVLGLILESICMPVTLLGLVDIWANIRKLPRNKS